MMTKEEFIKQKRERKTFLVITEEEGDSITPISLYRRMKGKKKFLLESSQLHQDKGRYSYLGCNPYGEVKKRWYGSRTNDFRPGRKVTR